VYDIPLIINGPLVNAAAGHAHGKSDHDVREPIAILICKTL
jgi:hypothetical protein